MLFGISENFGFFNKQNFQKYYLRFKRKHHKWIKNWDQGTCRFPQITLFLVKKKDKKYLFSLFFYLHSLIHKAAKPLQGMELHSKK